MAFSDRRRKISASGKNSVLFGDSSRTHWEVTTKYGLPNEILCRNSVGWIQYTCDTHSKYCKKYGEHCFTWHSQQNGHLFYRETECV